MNLNLDIHPLSYYQYLTQNKYRKYITTKGRKYKEDLHCIFIEYMKDKEIIKGKVKVIMKFSFSNKRKNDLDNFIKPLLDCMSGIIFEDDRQVYQLEVSKEDGMDKEGIVINIISI